MSCHPNVPQLSAMCLKYFVGHSTCDHHQYLGSHHCRTTPCNFNKQHFHYIEDSFPIPSSLDCQAERSALACKTCAAKHRDRLDPDEIPVQYYPPPNNFDTKELRPTGYPLPVKVVKAKPDGMNNEVSENCEYDYDYDYKSLSDADEEEWNTVEEQGETMNVGAEHDEILAQMHRNFVQNQLKDLPNYLSQRRQILPFVPPGLTPEVYTRGNYLHYPMPHMAYLAPSSVPSIPRWHGGLPALSSVHIMPMPTSHKGLQAASPPVQKDNVVSTTAAALQQRPGIAPPTPSMHPLPPRPPPPFIVGSITDAYLRIEAAKRRHMRGRARRAQSSLRDALPARSMALTDFIVYKRARKMHYRDVDATKDVELDTWSSLPFADDESDAEGGAEEYAGIVGSDKTTCRFSCRLVTLM